jgi:hypothetical protein
MSKGAGPAIARKGGHPAILRKGWGFPDLVPEFEFCICDTCPPLDEFGGVESWYGVDWTALTFSDASPRTFTTGDAVWPVLLAHAFDPPSGVGGISGSFTCLSLTNVGGGYFGVTPVEGPVAVTSGGVTIGYKWRYGPGIPYYNTVTEAWDTTDEDCWVFVRVTSLKRVIVKETLPVLKPLGRMAATRNNFKYDPRTILAETIESVEYACLYLTCCPFYFEYHITYETEVEFHEDEEGASGDPLQETIYGPFMWESFVGIIGLAAGGTVIFQIASLTSYDWVGPGEFSLTSSWFCEFAARCITNATVYYEQTVATGVACISDETTVTMTSVACNTTPMGGLNLLDWPAITATLTFYFCDPLP